MVQRISRATQVIKAGGLSLAQPVVELRTARLAEVRHVLGHVFTEVYKASVGRRAHRARAVHGGDPASPGC
ncbi:hypothetical protein STANM309S_05754 [Streptomyces tanashiensis]